MTISLAVRWLNLGTEIGAALALMLATVRIARWVVDAGDARRIRWLLLSVIWLEFLLVASTTTALFQGRPATIFTWLYAPTMVEIMILSLGLSTFGSAAPRSPAHRPDRSP